MTDPEKEAVRVAAENIREIIKECHNGGYPNEIVATRMIERIELFALGARDALARLVDGQTP